VVSPIDPDHVRTVEDPLPSFLYQIPNRFHAVTVYGRDRDDGVAACRPPGFPNA
jgi:hypothetical protein